jgi:predicted nucleic acid-binding protein
LVLCPIIELGFIRISTGPAFNATMEDARQALADFILDENPEFIPADIRALDGDPAPASGKTTDWYLANLADQHGMKWATLDTGAKHSAATVLA